MAQPFVRIRVQGTLLGGETWSINPAFIGNFTDPTPSQAQANTWTAAIASDLASTNYSSLLSLLSSAGAITAVRLDAYDATGTLKRTSITPLATPKNGSGALDKPYTSAMVLSLLTGVPGRSFRGRLYWPALKVTLDAASATVGASTCAAIADDARLMLRAMETAAPTGLDPVLAVYSSKLGEGTAVNQLRVGNILDSQSRRRDALQETYAVQAFPGS